MYIKVQEVENFSQKSISLGSLIKLLVVFGNNNFARYADFKVIELKDGINVAELVNVPEVSKSFENHDNLIGYKVKFDLKHVVDVKA